MGATTNFNPDEFGQKSEAFYETKKDQLESAYKGKYAALDYESKKFWIGDTASDALQAAKKEQPGRLFYVVLVGAPTTFMIQSVRASESPWSGNLYGLGRMDR